ncbi:MAG TPA: hypothetical protein VFT14_01335 [Solirubrobacterales bacterium]|nr:hypothetical protein [Solirubrobacterales bacterium]
MASHGIKDKLAIVGMGCTKFGERWEASGGRPARRRRLGVPGVRPRDLPRGRRREAGDRQIDDPKLGMTHDLGGRPGTCVSCISIVGKEEG